MGDTIYRRRNEEVLKQGSLGKYASELSKEIMKLPEEEREGAANVVMQELKQQVELPMD